ncbi:hypothetical protein glysoja_008522 [Glycine soja]|nr:hypothetical protein glysoja_008522 [Glycine soja]
MKEKNHLLAICFSPSPISNIRVRTARRPSHLKPELLFTLPPTRYNTTTFVVE